MFNFIFSFFLKLFFCLSPIFYLFIYLFCIYLFLSTGDDISCTYNLISTSQHLILKNAKYIFSRSSSKQVLPMIERLLLPDLSISSTSAACNQEVLQSFGRLSYYNLTQHHNNMTVQVNLYFLLISVHLYLFVHDFLSSLRMYLIIYLFLYFCFLSLSIIFPFCFSYLFSLLINFYFSILIN
jgi:hypothetical protein